VNRRVKKKAYLEGRLLFLFASDRGVSCLRRPYHDTCEAVMDWNQIRDYLEEAEVIGLAGAAIEDGLKFYLLSPPHDFS